MILEVALLALAWMALTGDWSFSAAVFSLALGWLLLRLARPLGGEGFRRVRLARLPGFLLFFLKEIVVANLRVAAAVLAPAGRLRPAIVAVPLALDRDAEIALLANLHPEDQPITIIYGPAVTALRLQEEIIGQGLVGIVVINRAGGRF